MIGQCLLFFLAGYETTASTISFLIYNLTIHPDIQEKVYQEIVDVVGDRVKHTLQELQEFLPYSKGLKIVIYEKIYFEACTNDQYI